MTAPRRAPSLSRRLLVSVSLPLVLFFGLTIVVLDANFRELSERSLRDLLEAQMVALIGAAEPRGDGAVAPLARGLETRLTTPGSGLYAEIRTGGQPALWRSPSTAGAFIDFGPTERPGGRSFRYAVLPDGARVAIANRGISLEEGGSALELTFSVATSMAPYDEQLWSFRSRLFGWFLGLTLLLLATLGFLLRWVLAPVRRLEREITHVEDGRRDTLGAAYPRELSGVAANLNTLLIGERKRVARYRDTLGNLAHSLKTPLAVMRVSKDPAALGAEIDRMSGIIEHQLKRAAASGGALLGQAPVNVAPIATELRTTLLKVHGARDFALELAVPGELQFLGDRGDLTELLGNLLDNACKWCRARVRLSAHVEPQTRSRARLVLVVEDDGPGISDADRTRVLERGVRADEKTPGHGLGLAMVRDIVELYGGSLTLSRSALGGACWEVRLPGR
ncbi:MAG TPA: ATP-binding protein [Steroidobacteraceae bacterium]|nr:ATP-binding protein [Steroidobacteraceae bacterium]